MVTESTSGRKWINLRDAVALAMMSAVSFILETTLGLVLLPFIPFPLMGGLLSGFFDAVLIFTANFIVPRRGGASLFAILLLTMSTVTPSFGPVGAYKIFIGAALGLTLDLLLLIIGRSATAYVIATSVAFSGSIPITYLAWKYFGVPGIDRLLPLLLWLTLAYALLGAVGALAGHKLYRSRLERHDVVRRLRAGLD